ncbi:MAG: hypothetical protein FWC51_04160 [Proteobacteria bacterium]|nr:hypothetical protein [Pseudomonadota bacterium]
MRDGLRVIIVDKETGKLCSAVWKTCNDCQSGSKIECKDGCKDGKIIESNVPGATLDKGEQFSHEVTIPVSKDMSGMDNVILGLFNLSKQIAVNDKQNPKPTPVITKTFSVIEIQNIIHENAERIIPRAYNITDLGGWNRSVSEWFEIPNFMKAIYCAKYTAPQKIDESSIRFEVIFNDKSYALNATKQELQDLYLYIKKQIVR